MRSRASALGFLVAAGVFNSAVGAQEPPKADPERVLWASLKEQLTGPEADNYFNSSVKDAQLPTLRGTLGPHDKFDVVLEVAMPDSTRPEVTILLSQQAVHSVDKLQSGAKIEFSGVAIGFSKSPFNLSFEVEDAQAPVASLGAMASDWYLGPDQGTVQSGRYRQSGLGLEFDLPADWSVRETRPSTAGGDVAVLTNPRFEGGAGVWSRGDRIPASEIPGRLQKLLTEVAAQRPDLARYAVRPESARTTWIGGKQALRAIANFETSAGQSMSETLTAIVTERARVVFFARANAGQFDELQSSFDRLVYSATIR